MHPSKLELREFAKCQHHAQTTGQDSFNCPVLGNRPRQIGKALGAVQPRTSAQPSWWCSPHHSRRHTAKAQFGRHWREGYLKIWIRGWALLFYQKRLRVRPCDRNAFWSMRGSSLPSWWCEEAHRGSTWGEIDSCDYRCAEIHVKKSWKKRRASCSGSVSSST